MAPCENTIASCAASASNLFGAEVNFICVMFDMRSATASPKPLGAFSPVPTAVPPCASCISAGKVWMIRTMPFSTCCA